jgi:hypothetical protein
MMLDAGFSILDARYLILDARWSYLLATPQASPKASVKREAYPAKSRNTNPRFRGHKLWGNDKREIFNLQFTIANLRFTIVRLRLPRFAGNGRDEMQFLILRGPLLRSGYG